MERKQEKEKTDHDEPACTTRSTNPTKQRDFFFPLLLPLTYGRWARNRRHRAQPKMNRSGTWFSLPGSFSPPFFFFLQREVKIVWQWR